MILVAQVGLSGSVTIGDGSILAGKVGVVDHINIGSGSTVGGRSTVTKNIKDNVFVWGTPARDFKRAMKEQAMVAKLPELARQIKRLEKELAQLREERGSDD